MRLTFLTPLAALLALGAVVPLLALAGVRRRAGRAREALGLPPVRRRALLAPVLALLAAAALLGLASAQPVLEQTAPQRLRTDAQAFFVLDVSRSMLAQDGPDGAMRIDRARARASELRAALGDVPVGIASMTDRVLPHLFPSGNADVFEATLERSLGIEQPPPRGSFLTIATSLASLGAIRTQRFFPPTAEKRLLVVFTDGESVPVATARLGRQFRRDPAIESIFVHVWGEDERVYARGAPEPQYLSDPSSRALLDSLARAARGSVFDERSAGPAAQRARQLLGKGRTVVHGRRSGREELAPYLALAALLPVCLLLWRRER